MVKVTLVPAMRFKAPCVAFAVPFVENIEGRLEELMVPVIPVAGTEVAVMVPVPLVAKEAPLPTTIAEVVLVPDVIPLKATEVVPVAAMVIEAIPPDKPLFVIVIPVPAVKVPK